jgi:hypothetical protein
LTRGTAQRFLVVSKPMREEITARDPAERHLGLGERTVFDRLVGSER